MANQSVKTFISTEGYAEDRVVEGLWLAACCLRAAPEFFTSPTRRQVCQLPRKNVWCDTEAHST